MNTPDKHCTMNQQDQGVQLLQSLEEFTTSFPTAETAKTSFVMYASTTNGIRLKARR